MEIDEFPFNGRRFYRGRFNPVSLSITASASTTAKLNSEQYSAIIIKRTSGSVDTLNVYAGESADATFKPLLDTDGNAITVTVGTSWKTVNLLVFAAPFLAFVGNTTGVVQVLGKG